MKQYNPIPDVMTAYFMSENIISGIQRYNKKYHQKLNHFLKTEKDD